MSPHSKKTSLVLSALFLVISCLIFTFLYKKINDNNKVAEQIQIEWQTEANQREEINSLDSSLKSIEKEKIQLESHFAQSSDIVPFLNTIEKLGSQAKAQAEVSSVDILKENTGLSVGMKASGSFEAVYKFLMLLENSPYELEFTAVDIQKDAGGGVDADGKSIPSGWTAVFKVRLLSFVP